MCQFLIVEVGFANLELDIHHISYYFGALCLISGMIHLFLSFFFLFVLRLPVFLEKLKLVFKPISSMVERHVIVHGDVSSNPT